MAASIFAAVISAPASPPLAALEAHGLDNLHRLSDRIYSGAQPEGPEAFAGLARLGIKTIVSVDGVHPDVAAAEKAGLRCVHLPIGYGGIPAERAVELVKAAQVLEGPIYVHCHHGKHRGPAAAAVMCEGIEHWTPARAEAWLREAGTSDDYPGLYRAVREFRPPGEAELAKVSPTFPAVAGTDAMVDGMVGIEARFDSLRRADDDEWVRPAPDSAARLLNDAILMHEHFQELVRTGRDRDDSPDLARKMTAARQAGEVLVSRLREFVAGPDEARRAQVAAAFAGVAKHCGECHREHRN